MIKLQPCLLALLALSVLVHASFGSTRFVDTEFQPGDQNVRHSVTARLFPLGPRTSNVSTRIAEDVLHSHSRLQFLRSGSKLGSSVSAVPGGYAMSIQLGSSPQTFSAIADTGSDLIWVQCQPCSECFSQPDALFNPSKSSTYSTLPCSNMFCQDLPEQSCSATSTCLYEYGYGDQSTTNGVLSSDTVYLSPTSFPGIAFGCGTNNQGTFQDVDGLVGLGLGPLSLPSQLSSTVSHIFSYCLAQSGSGYIVFGDSAASGGAVYTPLVANSEFPSFYYVTLNDISVGGNYLNIPSSTFAVDVFSGEGGIIFDSGTTFTMLAAAGYETLSQALQSAVPYPIADGSQVGLETCFDVSGVPNPTFPTVTFNFAGADFVLPTQNTFVAADPLGNTVCLAMAASSGFTIFGNIQQQNFRLIYDIVNSQLGWAAAQC